MVPRLVASLSVVLTFVLAAAPARGANASSDAPAGARLLMCHRAPSIDDRVATVGTSMRPISGGRHLAVKIDLWERTPGARWTLRSDVPGLGGWTTPSDALVGTSPDDVFKYRQAVGRLEVPAAYRFHVAFRWLDDDGAIVQEASRTTAVCRQPDMRPDLVLRSVMATPVADGSVRYVVGVGNEGRSAVARATVAATLPGDSAPGLHSRGVRSLAPSATAVVRFVGPGCAAGELPASFLADPSNAVDEVDDANNAASAACPAP